MRTIAATALFLVGCSATVWPKPPIDDKAGTARWIVANAPYAFLATLDSSRPGAPRNNVISTANITQPSTKHEGVPVFYTSPLDASSKDIKVNNNVSVAFSEAELGLCGEKGNWSKPDPEDPLCARLALMGRFVAVGGADKKAALAQLFERHPEMRKWPADHDWAVSVLELDEVWLIDVFGGATLVPPIDYWAWRPPSD